MKTLNYAIFIGLFFVALASNDEESHKKEINVRNNIVLLNKVGTVRNQYETNISRYNSIRLKFSMDDDREL